MLEIDWSVGQIDQALKTNGIDENTIVIFSSDNGPWVSYGNHAGSTPYREAKSTSFDGGIRSACIIKYPQMIKPQTTSSNTFYTIDLLPTLCKVAGVELPQNEIDGKNVLDLIIDKPDTENPHEYYAFTNGKNFEGVMSGDGNWKLHIPHQYRTLDHSADDGNAGKYRMEKIDTALFDIKADPMESINVLKSNPEIAKKLLQFAQKHQDRFFSENAE